MCLLVDSSNILVAEDDIVCYKVFEVNLKTGKLNTFFQHFQMNWDQVYTRLRSNSLWYVPHRHGYIVDKGYFHSFKEDDAFKFGLLVCYYYFAHLSTTTRIPVIAKCIIPKNTKYYVGKYNGEYDSYASKSIIIQKEFYIQECFVDYLTNVIENWKNENIKITTFNYTVFPSGATMISYGSVSTTV